MSKRRTLLKAAMIVLGASALLQPSGAVMGLSQDAPKKGDTVSHETVNKTNAKKSVKKEGGKKKGKKKEETPKKEGG